MSGNKELDKLKEQHTDLVIPSLKDEIARLKKLGFSTQDIANHLATKNREVGEALERTKTVK